jgi:hypothetical protein
MPYQLCLEGVAQLRAPVKSNCWYTAKTLSAKSHGVLVVSVHILKDDVKAFAPYVVVS